MDTKGDGIALDPLAVTLDTGPHCVPQARLWVADACRALERGDLVDCAELAISELVTNALVHGAPPIRVRVTGTSDRPRFEVSDASSRLPVVSDDPPGDSPSVGGRGMALAGRCSETWGTRVAPDGKTMWFEPASSPHDRVIPLEVSSAEHAGAAAPTIAT